MKSSTCLVHYRIVINVTIINGTVLLWLENIYNSIIWDRVILYNHTFLSLYILHVFISYLNKYVSNIIYYIIYNFIISYIYLLLFILFYKKFILFYKKKSKFLEGWQCYLLRSCSQMHATDHVRLQHQFYWW